MTKKKNVEKERIDKLEKCVRDKDKRITKLEDTIKNVRTTIGVVGSLVSIILLIVGIFFLAKNHPDIFGELLKIFGVALIAFLITFLIMIMLIYLAGEKLSDDENLSFSLMIPILMCIVITLIYVLVTYHPPSL